MKGTESFLPEGLIFWPSRDLPLEGQIFPATPIKSTLPTHPLVRGYIEKWRSQEKYFLQALIFQLSRDLPLEGENFFPRSPEKRPLKWLN